MVEDKIQEMITKGTFMIDTDGSVIGQINGLAVYNMGDYAFGKPSRITCETFMGNEGIVNIESMLEGPNGIYFLEINSANGSRGYTKIVKN